MRFDRNQACFCESGQKFKRCCYLNLRRTNLAKINCSYVHKNQPDCVGQTNEQCYAAIVVKGECCSKISKEHGYGDGFLNIIANEQKIKVNGNYLSKSLQDRLLDPSWLHAPILCVKHNNMLKHIDAVGCKFARAIKSIFEYVNFGKEIQERFDFIGEDIERVLVKLWLGSMYHTLATNKKLGIKFIPQYDFISFLFDRSPFLYGSGLWVVADNKLYDSTGDLLSLVAENRGIYSVELFNGQYKFNLISKEKAEYNGKPGIIYRPTRMRFRRREDGAASDKIIVFHWKAGQFDSERGITCSYSL